MEMNSTRMLSIGLIFVALSSILGTCSRISQSERIKELEQRLEAFENAREIPQDASGGQDGQDH